MKTRMLFTVFSLISLLLPCVSSKTAAAPPAVFNYIVQVTTANCTSASTNARVCIRINGLIDVIPPGSGTRRGGKLPSIIGPFLLSGGSCNPFESGKQDLFLIQSSVQFSDILSITLSHDNKGPDPSWLPTGVKILEDRAFGRMWNFPIFRWLARNKCLGEIRVTAKRDVTLFCPLVLASEFTEIALCGGTPTPGCSVLTTPAPLCPF